MERAAVADGGGDVDEATALLFAAESGAVGAIQAWVARGGDINAPLTGHGRGESEVAAGWTPLALAAHRGHAVAVRTLLESGARGSQAAHIAAKQGHAAALEALLEWGVDPNSQDEYGQTPLHYAAAFGHAPIVRQLLRHGASPAVIEATGRTPIDLAVAAGYRDIVTILQPGNQRVGDGGGVGGAPAPPSWPLAPLPSSMPHDGSAPAATGSVPASARAAAAAAYGSHASPMMSAPAATPLGRHPSPFAIPPHFMGVVAPPRHASTVALAPWAAGMDASRAPWAEAGAGTGLGPHGGGSAMMRAHADAALTTTLRSCTCHGGRTALHRWLDSIGLGHLFLPFVVCGYDDAGFLASAGLTDADVAAICSVAGVTLPPGHVKKLTSLYGIRAFLPHAADGVKAVSPVSARSGSDDGSSVSSQGDERSSDDEEEEEEEEEEDGYSDSGGDDGSTSGDE